MKFNSKSNFKYYVEPKRALLSFTHSLTLNRVLLASLLCATPMIVIAAESKPPEPVNSNSIKASTIRVSNVEISKEADKKLKEKSESKASKEDDSSMFFDPKDGNVDASKWMSEQHGFLPIPIVITGPTFGFGLGLNLMFLHDSLGGDSKSTGRKSPPSVSGVVVGGTENGSKFGAAYNIAYLKEDTIRSTTLAGVPDANLDFYPTLPSGEERQVEMNLSGLLAYQELKFRVKDSNFFLGGNVFYSKVDSQFADNESRRNLLNSLSENEVQAVSIAAVAEYDTRDSTFTPSKGLYSKLVASRYSETLGSDFDAWNIRGKSFYFTPVTDDLVLGLRGEFEGVQTTAPYYMHPSINMRGIATGRYQGQFTTTFETEIRYALDYRWNLIGFIGSGKAFGDSSEVSDKTSFTDTDWESAVGVGFRYKIASKFRLHVGLDLAMGPEDTAIYITTGQAWNAVF